MLGPSSSFMADKGLLDGLYEVMEDIQEDVRFGLSSLLEGGVILRVLARTTGMIEKMITHAHGWARHQLLAKGVVRWRKY